MESQRKVGNALALSVLAELLMGPMHPYEMGRRLKEHGKDRHIRYNRGSLYMVVEQLRKAGFVVEHQTVRDTARPERTVYAITDAGRTELHDWMRELVATPRQEYPQFLVALSLITVLAPTEAGELLGQRLRHLEREREESRGTVRKATGDGVPWVFLVEEEYRLAVLEAEHRFVTRLIQSLQREDYVRMQQDPRPQGPPHPRQRGQPRRHRARRPRRAVRRRKPSQRHQGLSRRPDPCGAHRPARGDRQGGAVPRVRRGELRQRRRALRRRRPGPDLSRRPGQPTRTSGTRPSARRRNCMARPVASSGCRASRAKPPPMPEPTSSSPAMAGSRPSTSSSIRFPPERGPGSFPNIKVITQTDRTESNLP